jgi:tRNA nucleotidyltransferase (CCA-adding enzyme)
MSFSILKHSAAIDEKGNCALIFLFKELYISEQEIKIGPEVYMKESLEKFLSKNNKNNQLIWIGKDSKINVLQKRDYTYAKNFIRHLLTNKIFSSGIAPDLITELAKSYRIIEGNEINQLSTKYIWLKDEVNELIANDKIFER